FGGRIVLIKSVLSNLPIYFLSLFRALASVIKRIEKIQNNFLWVGASDVRKYHLVGWEKVKVPKDAGGIGIMDLRSMNVALLGKWHWCFWVEQQSWWRGLIKDKFGLQDCSEWRSVRLSMASGWSIRHWILTENLHFWRFAYVNPGGGEWYRFWHDVWLPGRHLAREFLRSTAAARFPYAYISDIFSLDDRSSWTIPLSISLRRGAAEEHSSLIQMVNNLPLGTISSGPPLLTWSLDTKNGFLVKSFLKAVTHYKYPGNSLFPSKQVWISYIPTKICGFIWLAYLGAISMIDNLQPKGVIIPKRCSLCRMEAETVSHLLLHCQYSSKVWGTFVQTTSRNGPFPCSIAKLWEEWEYGSDMTTFRKFHSVIQHAIMWHIWLERNDRILRDKECIEVQLA
ncbi:Putative ribonuclease H protein At1g65750, partial [Linum grandiflorum]